MTTPGDRSAASPVGVWMHAHEDEAGDRLVFRRAEAAPPPSRGRAMLTFKADGSVSGTRPGPDDRPVPVQGQWTLDPDHRVRLDLGDRAALFDLEGADRLTSER